MPRPTTKEGLTAFFELHIQLAPAHTFTGTAQTCLRAIRIDDHVANLFLKHFARTLTADERFEFRALLSMFELQSAQEQGVPEQTSSLLKLAPELRNRIYEYALVPADGVRIEESSKAMSLLQTCSFIRKEASPMFFAQNTFHATANSSNHHRIIDWLHLHATHVPQIQKLSIGYQLSDDEVRSIEQAVQRIAEGTRPTSASRTTGQIFLSATTTCQALLRQIRTRKLLRMASVTAPEVELPAQEQVKEYLQAQVARYWSRVVAKGAQ